MTLWPQSLVGRNVSIEQTLRGIGVQWLRTVDSYRVDDMRKTLQKPAHLRAAALPFRNCAD